MVLDSGLRNRQRIRDLAIRIPLGDQLDHSGLATRERPNYPGVHHRSGGTIYGGRSHEQ